MNVFSVAERDRRIADEWFTVYAPFLSVCPFAEYIVHTE